MKYFAVLTTVIWFLFMTYLSHQDGEHTSRTSRDLVKLLFHSHNVEIINAYVRKAAHIIVFLVLSLLSGFTMFLFETTNLYLIPLQLIWAYLDELTKRTIRGRHFSWTDVLLNMTGVLIGNMILIFL